MKLHTLLPGGQGNNAWLVNHSIALNTCLESPLWPHADFCMSFIYWQLLITYLLILDFYRYLCCQGMREPAFDFAYVAWKRNKWCQEQTMADSYFFWYAHLCFAHTWEIIISLKGKNLKLKLRGAIKLNLR